MITSLSDPAVTLADDGRPLAAPAPAPRQFAIEFLRYFIASGGALGVDLGLFRLSLHLGLAYPLAALIGFCTGATAAYVASIAWVFKARSCRRAGVEFGLFVAIGAAGLLLTEALLWLQIERFALPALRGKVCAAGVVFVFNFVVRKTMLFRVRAA
jgi:putative flippase GtrA